MNFEEYSRTVAILDADIAARPVRPIIIPQANPEPAMPPLQELAQDVPPTPARAVVLACGTDLKPEPVRWLWRDWLALGKLHILAGAPGQGKTTLALAMAATVTVGGHWPDGTRCERGNILVWSGEDDHADTLLPRLLAAGADRARCYFVEGTRNEDGTLEPFDPAHDLPRLQEAVQKIGGVRLLIVDPIVSAVVGDSHKNTEVRRALQPVVDLASACGFAVLGITHFSKGGQGTDPAQRVVGSVAFTAVARVVLVAAKVQSEDGEDRRILARSKSNIGPDDGGLEYRLEQREPLPGLFASCVAWGRTVTGTARELLTDPNDEASDTTDTNDAAELLRAELAGFGWVNSEVASKPLIAAGFTKKQIWKASKALSIQRKKDGMRGGWVWRLPPSLEDSAPEDSREDSEDSPFGKLESLESSAESSHLESSAGTTEGSTKSAKSARLENTLPSLPSVLPSCFDAQPPTDMEEVL